MMQVMNKRQVLGDGGILGGIGDGLSSIGGALTSGVGELTSAILPPTTTTTSTSATTSTTPSQTDSSTSSTSATTSSSSSSSSSSSESSTSSTPSATPSPSEAVVTSDGQPVTITSFVSPTSSAAAESSTTVAPSGKSFLQNKPVSGAVFGIVGLIGLILIFIIATWGIRRAKRKQLMNEAMSFDPASHAYSDNMEQGLTEKRMSLGSTHSGSGGGGSSYGHGNFPPGGYYGAAAPPPPMPTSYGRPNYPNYAPPQRSPTTGSNYNNTYNNYGAAADFSKQLPQVPNVAYDAGRGPYPQMNYGQASPPPVGARSQPTLLPQTFGDHDADERAQTFGSNLKVANE